MPISFTKTSWVDFTTKVTATQMNRIEKGIDDSVIQLNNIDSGTYKVPKATDSDKLGNKLPSEYAPAVHNHALNLGEEIIALFNGDVNTLNGVCDATFTGLDASNIPTREHYHVINLGAGDVADRGAQLAIDTYGGNIFYRSMRSGYTTWKKIIHQGNISSYAKPLDVSVFNSPVTVGSSSQTVQASQNLMQFKKLEVYWSYGSEQYITTVVPSTVDREIEMTYYVGTPAVIRASFSFQVSSVDNTKFILGAKIMTNLKDYSSLTGSTITLNEIRGVY